MGVVQDAKDFYKAIKHYTLKNKIKDEIRYGSSLFEFHDDFEHFWEDTTGYELDRRGLSRRYELKKYGGSTWAELRGYTHFFDEDRTLDRFLDDALERGEGEKLYSALRKRGKTSTVEVLEKFDLYKTVQGDVKDFLRGYKRHIQESYPDQKVFETDCSYCGAPVNDEVFIEKGKCEYCNHSLKTTVIKKKETVEAEKIQEELPKAAVAGLIVLALTAFFGFNLYSATTGNFSLHPSNWILSVLLIIPVALLFYEFLK